MKGTEAVSRTFHSSKAADSESSFLPLFFLIPMQENRRLTSGGFLFLLGKCKLFYFFLNSAYDMVNYTK